MNMSEMEKQICRETGYSAEAVQNTLHSLFGIMARSLAAGDEVSFRGWGAFRVSKYKVNSPEGLDASERHRVLFKSGKRIKDILNGIEEAPTEPDFLYGHISRREPRIHSDFRGSAIENNVREIRRNEPEAEQESREPYDELVES